MSEKATNLQEFIQPARLTDDQTGQVYELDFSKESVVFAERNKFKLEDVRGLENVGDLLDLIERLTA